MGVLHGVTTDTEWLPPINISAVGIEITERKASTVIHSKPINTKNSKHLVGVPHGIRHRSSSLPTVNAENVHAKTPPSTETSTMDLIVNPISVISKVVRSSSLCEPHSDSATRSAAMTAPVGVSAAESAIRYKYLVSSGNNSRVILSALRLRPWWSPARKEDEEAANVNMCWTMFLDSKGVEKLRHSNPRHRLCMNHIEGNSNLVSKRGLYYSILAYCERTHTPITSIVPRTWHLLPPTTPRITTDTQNYATIDTSNDVCDTDTEDIKHTVTTIHISSSDDESTGDDSATWETYCKEHEVHKPVWIVKPAAITNRGMGIKICSTREEVLEIISNTKKNNKREV